MEYDNPIPSGIEIRYYDKFGRPTDQENAVKVIITEYDENGEEIRGLLSAKSQTE